MVNDKPSDLIPMGQFGLSWRITDPRWASLPADVLSRIQPLSPAKSHELYESSLLNIPVGQSTDVEGYRVSRRRSLVESGDAEGDAEIRRWFEELGINREQHVYLCWNAAGGVAAITDWGTFLETWSDLWYPFDHLCVFDETSKWALLFGPEEEVAFLESSVPPTTA